MKKITLFLAFILLGSFAFASFPVKTEKAKTILTEQISIETENNTPIETETTQISFYDRVSGKRLYKSLLRNDTGVKQVVDVKKRYTKE